VEEKEWGMDRGGCSLERTFVMGLIGVLGGHSGVNDSQSS